MANAWKTITQSRDTIKFNSRNACLDIHLLAARQDLPQGKSDVRIFFWTRPFKEVNNQRIFTAEEEVVSNIYTIQRGNGFKTNF